MSGVGGNLERSGSVRYGGRLTDEATYRVYAKGFERSALDTPAVSFSVSAFYNVYDDLRTIEVASAGFLPLRWGNGMRGDTAGAEVWGNIHVTDCWRLAAGFNLQHEHLCDSSREAAAWWAWSKQGTTPGTRRRSARR